MRRVVLVTLGLSVAAILFTVCSKKSAGPGEKPPPEPPGAPVIEKVSRSGGWVGQEVLIGGENFGDKQDSSTVTLGDSLAVIDHWSETLIDTEVPTGAKSGDIVVTVNGMQSNSIPFKVYGIDRVVPVAGYPGTEVRLFGSGFTNYQGSSTVRFGNRNATISSWSDTLIAVIVPTGALTGSIVLTYRQHQSEWGVFVVPDSLEITSIEPLWGPWGTEVTITGFGFGEDQGWSVATFGGTEAQIVSWSDSTIVAEVPDSSLSGDVIVAAGGSIETNGIHFDVFMISDVIPLSVGVGDTCEILGEGFGDTQGDGSVTVGDIDLEILSWSDTLIQVAIPHGATSGNVYVSVNGEASNSVDLTVYLVPRISGIDPEWGPWGASVTITGSQFGNAQSTSSVEFNGIEASVSSWSYENIVTEFPHGCASGDVIVQVGDVESNPTPFSAFGIFDVFPARTTPGDTININGTGFGASQGSDFLTIKDSAMAVIAWSDDRIDAVVPDGVSSGDITVTINDVQSNPVYLTVLIPPVLSSIDPDFGTFGLEATITGSYFGDTKGSSSVEFDGESAPIISWSDETIVTEYPHGSNSGDVRVIVNDIESNPQPYTVFGIRYINPTDAVPGNTILIVGTGFGDSQGSSIVTLRDVPMQIAFWSDAAIQATVPEEVSSGDITVVIGGVRSNPAHLAVYIAPVLSSITPDFGTYGTEVVITGQHFGDTQGSSRAEFNGVAAPIVSWSNESIATEFPTGSSSGNLTVNVNGFDSNPLPFTVFGILSVNPVTAVAGDTVTIVGTGFGDTQGSASVTLRDTPLQVASWSSDEVMVIIPEGVSSGDIAVVIDGVRSNPAYLTVYIIPVLSSITPDFGTYGTEAIITGQYFGDMQGSSRVQFNGVTAPVVSWSDGVITTEFPFGSSSGNLVVSLNGFDSNPLPFTVFGIKSISPKTVLMGSSVAILGTGFGPEQLDSWVQLNSMEMPVIEWSDSLIRFEAAASAQSGPIRVVISGHSSNSADLHITTTSEVLTLLHQATTVKLTLSGLYVLEICWWSSGCNSYRTKSWRIGLASVCSGFDCACHTEAPLIWNESKFSSDLYFADGFREVSMIINGEVSADGSRVLFIDGQHDSSPAIPDECQLFESVLKCHDIGLFEVDEVESRLTYRGTGLGVQQLVDELYKRELYMEVVEPEDPGQPGEPSILRPTYTTYVSLIWDNEEHPPVLLVTFEKE